MKKTRLLLKLAVIIIMVTGCKKNASAINDTIPSDTSTFTYYKWSTFAMGSDLSFNNQLLNCGAVYRDSGLIKDPFVILKSHGNNVVRIRLWNNPSWVAQYNNGHIYSDLADVEKTIKRAKDLGMAVNLDLHYSDTWADPANQNTPTAWANLNLTTLQDSVYQFTTYVLNQLAAKNLTPEMIQIGNETNQGMLWPLGKVVNNNFTSFGLILKSGIKAVRDFSATSTTVKPLIILHVAQIQNADYFMDGVINKGGVTDFDIIGISHYVDYITFTQMSQVGVAIRNLKVKYNKKVMLVEASYPNTTVDADSYPNITTKAFAGYPLTHDGQYQYMKDLTQQVILGGGSGIMYWAPDWISTSYHDTWGTGSSWDNNTFFDIGGNALSVMDFMRYKYTF